MVTATAAIRPPAVAGLFYPGNRETLRSTIEQLLAEAPADDGNDPPPALVVPHAGYIYSGPIAATAYAQLRRHAHRIERVILLGPAHRVFVRGLALPGVQALATPLGNVLVDEKAVAAVSQLPQVVVRPDVHAQEHSLEVQLPFIQTVLPRARVLPLCVGDADEDEVAEVLEAVFEPLHSIILISSDLSHYLSSDEARLADEDTAQRIVAGDDLLDHEQACGATPLNGLLTLARRRGWHASVMDLRNSGDTAGDRSRVVGYGAFRFQ